jgi:hypothetical protein
LKEADMTADMTADMPQMKFSSKSSTRTSMHLSPIRKSKPGLPTWAQCNAVNPGRVRKIHADETKKWGKVVKVANIKVD